MATLQNRTKLLLSACAAAAYLGASGGGALAQQTIDFNKPTKNIVNYETDEEQFFCVDNDGDLECSGNGEANLNGPAPPGPGTDGEGEQ